MKLVTCIWNKTFLLTLSFFLVGHRCEVNKTLFGVDYEEGITGKVFERVLPPSKNLNEK